MRRALELARRGAGRGQPESDGGLCDRPRRARDAARAGMRRAAGRMRSATRWPPARRTPRARRCTSRWSLAATGAARRPARTRFWSGASPAWWSDARTPIRSSAGRGCACWREAGVEVETGVLEQECRRLNEVFFHFIQHRTPFVVRQFAMTLESARSAVRFGRQPLGERGGRHGAGCMRRAGSFPQSWWAWTRCWRTIRCSPAAYLAGVIRCALCATVGRAHRWTAA